MFRRIALISGVLAALLVVIARPASATTNCALSLMPTAYVRLTLKALEEKLITSEDIQQALRSDQPSSPLAGYEVTYLNSSFIDGFTKILGTPTLQTEWQAIRKALSAALALQYESDTQTAAAREDTQAFLNPQRIREISTSPQNARIPVFKAKNGKIYFAVEGPDKKINVYDIEKEEPIWTSPLGHFLEKTTLSEDKSGNLKIHFAEYKQTTYWERVRQFVRRKVHTETFTINAGDAKPEVRDLFIKPDGQLEEYLVDSAGREFLKFADQMIIALGKEPVLFKPTERSEISPWLDPGGHLHFAYFRAKPGGIHAVREFYDLTFDDPSWNTQLVQPVEGDKISLMPLRNGTVQLDAFAYDNLVNYEPTDLLNASRKSVGAKNFVFRDNNGLPSNLHETKAFATRNGRIFIAVSTSYSGENKVTNRVIEPAVSADTIYQWDTFKGGGDPAFYWFEDAAGNPYVSASNYDVAIHQPLNPSAQPIVLEREKRQTLDETSWISTKDQTYLFYRDNKNSKLRIHTVFTRVR